MASDTDKRIERLFGKFPSFFTAPSGKSYPSWRDVPSEKQMGQEDFMKWLTKQEALQGRRGV